MTGLLLAALAAAPSASVAERLAARKQWDELYLTFATATPEGTAPDEGTRLARVLLKGCAALVGGDAALALSLGEKSVAFASSADGLLCVARAAVKADQRGEADEVLSRGAKEFPHDARFALEQGRLALLEHDGPRAVALLSSVPGESRQGREAAGLLKQARALAAPSAVPMPPSAARPEVPIDRAPPRRGARSTVDPGQVSASYQSGVDDEGRRTRFNAHFRFRSFSAQRDFGQRADYEGTVQAALEVARLEAQKVLGVSREAPTDVILYSRDEFTMHHGAQAARSIAGFYSDNAIRMNDSAEMNDRNQATLVHEYVHATLDEVASFHGGRLPTWLHEGTAEWVEWRHQGFDGPPAQVKSMLRQHAASGRLPSLTEMAKGRLVDQGNPEVSYALSGAAVDELVRKDGVASLVALFEEVGKGAPFEVAFEKRYGEPLDQLERHLVEDLKSR